MSEEMEVTPEATPEATPVESQSLLNETTPEGITMEQYRGLFDEGFLEENGATLDRFQDPKDIFKSYQEARKMASRKGDIPQDWEDKDAVNEFFGKIGKPEGADGYEVEMPENFEISDGYVEKFREIAHENNLTKAQAENLFKEMSAFESGIADEQFQAEQDTRNEGVELLNREWGESKDEMSAAVQNLEKHFGMTEEQMDDIESNPHALLLLGKVAKALDEKGQVGNVFNSTRQGMEDQLVDIETEMIELMNVDPKSPKLQVLQQKRNDLANRSGKWLN